ncbi:Serpentine receptor class r-10 [Caenorhabditis elegans]|uniref:Serpentine receptor class r-10 n=1 Tax=Caenorhabditis elegans TaxID=6239 RepID=O45972_CAEEL|nr:Seven TM Receptor [Caenorhabditis elegans]CAA15966.3 Seven TM Receptor [Caenorhabditis elegans]|eukprot:NP_506908.3 Seven TM Receptor [Caenorhabditis elegans]
MCSTTWLEATHNAEIIGFFLSLTLNFILLFLISEMPKKTFGSYKYLMFSFSVLGIYYSCCAFWSNPNVHITEWSFIVFNVQKYTTLTKPIGTIAIGMYCSCYGMMLSLLTIHFYYRYLSVTCPSQLSRFSAKFVPIWAIIVVTNSSVWFFTSYHLNGPSQLKDLHVYPEFLKSYCLKPDDFAYASAQYFYEDHVSEGVKFHFLSLFATGVMAAIMVFTLSAIFYFGIQTYIHLYRLSSIAGLDNRELQNQLFRTLVVQTVIPFFFMYFPVSCMILLPLFGIKVKEIGNIAPIFAAIYPCFEPLVAMFIIKNFRYRIIGLLTCNRFKKPVTVPVRPMPN